VRPDGVVFLPPPLDHHPGLPQTVEDLPIEQFIPQLNIEALAVAVLPRAAKFNVERSGAHCGQPCPQHLGGELRSVVGTNVVRHATHQHDIGQGFDHHLRPDTALHADGQSLAGAFVNAGASAILFFRQLLTPSSKSKNTTFNLHRKSQSVQNDMVRQNWPKYRPFDTVSHAEADARLAMIMSRLNHHTK